MKLSEKLNQNCRYHPSGRERRASEASKERSPDGWGVHAAGVEPGWTAAPFLGGRRPGDEGPTAPNSSVALRTPCPDLRIAIRVRGFAANAARFTR